MNNKTIFRIFILWLCSLMFSCFTSDESGQYSYTYQVPAVRNDGWETAHLSSHSIDVQLIEEMVLRIKKMNFAMSTAC